MPDPEPLLNTAALREIFDAAWSEKNAIEWEDEDASKESAWALLETYFQQTPIPPDEKPDGVEVRMETDLSAHGLPVLVGILDLVRAGGGMVDFKTAARSPDPKMIAHTHEIQTTAYGVLYREATGHAESSIAVHHLIKTKVPKLVVSELGVVTDEQISRLYRVIESYMDGVMREDFVPSPGLQCMSCEFFHECRAWH